MNSVLPRPTSLFGLSLLASCALWSSMTISAAAADPKTLSEMISQGTTKLSFRYRYEFVDQEGIDKEAGASTLKSRLTYHSAKLNGLGFGVEADYVTAIGSERYNSTINRNTQYPVVADPEGFDLNQAFVSYTSDDYAATAGRQRILLAGQRFVGGVGWRQNEQTYDAFRAVTKSKGPLSAGYTYVWNVNRIFGPDDGAQPSDWRSNSHLLDLGYKLNDKHNVSAYAYILDFDNDNGIPNSTATYGVAYRGTFGKLGLAGAVATQSDNGDSPLDYTATYLNAEASYNFGSVKLTGGYELLGSDDGIAGFRTPLATLHKFQGWTDKFLLTPANGIEDVYVGVSGSIGKLKVAANWHDLGADEGGADYGSEISFVTTLPVHKTLTLQLKLADYHAKDFATDTTKIWLSLMFNP